MWTVNRRENARGRPSGAKTGGEFIVNDQTPSLMAIRGQDRRPGEERLGPGTWVGGWRRRWVENQAGLGAV